MKYKYCKTDENFNTFKEARNQATAIIRTSVYNYEKDLAMKMKTDSKLFWKYVKNQIKNTNISR